MEAASRQGKLKAALQELDLLRERECARKAETRLRGLGSAEGEIRTAHSEGAKKRQGDKRGAAPASAPRTAATPLEVIPDPDPRSRSSVGSSSNVYASSDAEDDRSVESSTGGKGKGRGRGYVDAAVEQREEGSTPRFRPPSSALTPPRRPHYTIPPSSAVSLSAAGSRHQPLPRHGLSHSYTYESRAESSKVSTLPPSSLSLEVTSSERIPLSSMNHRHDDVSNKTTKQDRSLRSPPAVTSAQYFSDSELQHYERHSSSRSLADQKRQRRDDAKDSYPPRPPLSVSNFASSADPVCDPTPSGSRTKPSSPNHRISYDLDPDRDRDRVGPRGVQSTAERERDKVSKQSTDAACGQDRSVFREPEGTRSSSSSAMQARAEQLASRDKQLISHSASDTIAVARSFLSSSRAFVPLPTSASAPAASAVPPLSASIPIPIPIAGDYTGAGIGIGASAGLPSSRGQIPGSVGARYDRLQNMFERVTGSAAPAAWRDSDSDSSDTD